MFGRTSSAAQPEKALAVEAHAGARPGLTVLHVHGRIGLETVPEFLSAVRHEQAPLVILDLSDVSLVDSSGVGALIQTYAAFRKAGRQLALAGPSPHALAVLEVTRVKQLFKVYPTVSEAEAQLT